MSRPRRRGRDINGVLLLDKPQGMSSNDALQKVKRIYNANRAGHTGALDPLATACCQFASGKRRSFPSICWTPTNVIGSLRVLDSVPILLMPTDKSLKNVR